jgi:hypothetical protein
VSWRFSLALAELRGAFGVPIARIAAQNGLEVEDDLARILPVSDAEHEANPRCKEARKGRDQREGETP